MDLSIWTTPSPFCPERAANILMRNLSVPLINWPIFLQPYKYLRNKHITEFVWSLEAQRTGGSLRKDYALINEFELKDVLAKGR